MGTALSLVPVTAEFGVFLKGFSTGINTALDFKNKPLIEATLNLGVTLVDETVGTKISEVLPSNVEKEVVRNVFELITGELIGKAGDIIKEKVTPKLSIELTKKPETLDDEK